MPGLRTEESTLMRRVTLGYSRERENESDSLIECKTIISVK